MSAFGFNVENVFGSARKGTKRKSKKKKDSMDNMMEGSGMGIDSFSLAEPKVNALELGSDFGDQIGSRAGLSNGKGGGFLDIIGKQQRLPSARVTGRGRIARGKGKSRKVKSRGRVSQTQQSPLQRASGTRFGSVDDRFSSNVIGNIRGAKKRISAFREKRRKSKTESTRDRPQLTARDTPQLAFKQPALRGDIPPALEDKSRSGQ